MKRPLGIEQENSYIIFQSPINHSILQYEMHQLFKRTHWTYIEKYQYNSIFDLNFHIFSMVKLAPNYY